MANMQNFWGYYNILAFTLFPLVRTVLVSKELGTGQNIDVRFHPGYKFLPSLDVCGISSQQNSRSKRIVGGKPIATVKSPWMVQLYLLNAGANVSTLSCGGTIITENVILTASHCLSRLTAGNSLFYIAFGRSDRRKVVLCPWDHTRKLNCSAKNVREIEETIIHEHYSEGNLHNDIGLVILKKPIKFNSHARPICLPFSEELLKPWRDTKLQVTGWGIQNKYDSPRPKMVSSLALEVNIYLKRRNYCDQFHSRQYGKLDGSRFCGMGETNHGSCNGDSGGPLSRVLTLSAKNVDIRRVIQFGIVSSGAPEFCGLGGYPAIITNVLYFMPWILDKILKLHSFHPGETFSAESQALSFDEKPEKEIPLKNLQFKNELSTGLNVDIRTHRNFGILESIKDCGQLQLVKGEKSKVVDYGKQDEYSPDIPELEYYKDVESNEDFQKIKRRNKRIIGGVAARIGDFPFMAQIYAINVNTAERVFRCSGMIITTRHVLLAASCLTDLPTFLALDSIVVGNANRNYVKDCIGSVCSTAQVVPLQSAKMFLHDEFFKLTKENDVALIMVDAEFKFNPFIQPVCLPIIEEDIERLPDFKMISVGWGKTAKEIMVVPTTNETKPSSETSNLPIQVEINLRPREDCDRVYTRIIGKLNRSRLCGGGEAGKGECPGDEGGPLLKSVYRTVNGRLEMKYMQFGIISTHECGLQGLPSVYTNVLYFMPWILDHL